MTKPAMRRHAAACAHPIRTNLRHRASANGPFRIQFRRREHVLGRHLAWALHAEPQPESQI